MSRGLNALYDPLGTEPKEAYVTPMVDPISVPPDPERVGSGPSDRRWGSFRPARPRIERERPASHDGRSVRPARPPTEISVPPDPRGSDREGSGLASAWHQPYRGKPHARGQGPISVSSDPAQGSARQVERSRHEGALSHRDPTTRHI